MHFVDEQHLLVAQVGEDRGEVALDLQRGTRRPAETPRPFHLR